MYSSDHTGKEMKKRKKRNKQIKEIQYIGYMGLQWRTVAKKITIGAIAIMKPMNIYQIFLKCEQETSVTKILCLDSTKYFMAMCKNYHFIGTGI